MSGETRYGVRLSLDDGREVVVHVATRFEERALVEALDPGHHARLEAERAARRRSGPACEDVAFRWSDAIPTDYSTREGANAALRGELWSLRTYPADLAVPAAFAAARALEAAGWWWQARTLRAHAARVQGQPRTFTGARRAPEPPSRGGGASSPIRGGSTS